MADDYERKHMPGIGEVLFRQKVTTPAWLLGLVSSIPLALGAVGAVVGVADGLDGLGAAGILAGATLGSALMGGLMVVFAAGRIAVSEGELHIQIGPSGPRIPIASIRSVTIGASGTQRVGLGFKKGLDFVSIYSLFGDNARSVRIEREGGHPLVLVCKQPDEVAAALHEAMARHARNATTPRVRVASEEETAAEQSDAPLAREDERPATTRRT